LTYSLVENTQTLKRLSILDYNYIFIQYLSIFAATAAAAAAAAALHVPLILI
jgi:hypothetical protein